MKSNLTEKWIVCRICLEKPKGNMQTIFNQNAEKDLTRMILECGGVPIKKFDHYPDKICSKCLKCLHVAHRFRTTCQRSYKHLSRFIAPVEVDQQADEADSSNAIGTDGFDPQTHLLIEMAEVQENSTHKAVKMEPADVKCETQDDEGLLTMAAAAAGSEVDEEYYDFETYEEVSELHIHPDDMPENESANSEMSAEIEFLDELDDDANVTIVEHENEHNDYNDNEESYTSDEEFIPTAKRSTAKRATAQQRRKRKSVNMIKNGATRAEMINDIENVIANRDGTGNVPRRGRGRAAISKDKDKQQKYICDVCGNMYHSQGRLTEHIKLHSGIKPHECEICGHCFAQAQQLARHMNTHTGNRPFKCNYCTAAFADLSTRNKHHRIHTNERPYICDVCGKSFSYTNTLKFHKMIHTGEKPHVCDICGKGFNQAYKLRNHKKTHEKRGHTVSGIKMELDNIAILQSIDGVAGTSIMEI